MDVQGSLQMTDHLPDVKVTPEQADRAIAMAYKMRESYWGLFSAAGAIVSLQDQIAKLESDMAWIRRRTGFWGEVPSEPLTSHKNLLRDETAKWEVQKTDCDGNPVVTCHTRVVGGVLCRWWGDEAPPSGVEAIDRAAQPPPVAPDDCDHQFESTGNFTPRQCVKCLRSEAL